MPDVRDSFTKSAINYTRSTFHTSAILLQEVVDLAQPQKGDLALDVATGTGNTAFALAPHVRRVIGLDLTRPMLDEARRMAAEKRITNCDWVIGDAERLPFPDETFDVYTVRAAPHHFPHVDVFIEEAFRVLKPGRDAAFVDCTAPLPSRDFLHPVEIGRDPAHILSLTVEEWVAKLERAGFVVESAQARELDWEFEGWMDNQNVPRERRVELAEMIESAQGEVRTQLHPERREGKLWHAYWHALIRAHKPG